MASLVRFAAAALAASVLAGCQPDAPGTSSASDEDCHPGLGSHLCSAGPSDPGLGVDPSIQSEGAAGRGGGH